MANIIANHTIVEDYSIIPQYYIDEVKKLLVTIAGMSHSNGYYTGATLLEALDNRFQVVTSINIQPVPQPGTTQLTLAKPWQTGATIWTSPAGIADAKVNQLAYDVSNPYDAYIFGWSYQATWDNDPGGGLDPVYNVHWAGQTDGGVDGNLRWGLDAADYALTGNHVCMDTYLSAFEEFITYCSTNLPTTHMIFSTLIVDGHEGTEAGFQRELKSEHIREYINTQDNKILFDFGDILSHNDAGEAYYGYWNDGGNLRAHHQIHPDNLMDYDSSWNIISPGVDELEDHIGEVGALRVGKALWWTLARMVGWDGLAEDSTIHYIDPTGSNTTGDGTYANPWATLAYACTQVTTSGHTIHVNAGTYIETTQSALSVGVSITGAGVGVSIIRAGAALNPIIAAFSGAENTLGNQSISYITIDGDLTAITGIRVLGRSSVIIHHVDFIDCIEYAIIYNGRVSGDGAPTVYAQNNKIYNCNITNCGHDTWYPEYNSWFANAAIDVPGQDEMEIYNCDIDNVTGGRHGYGIKALSNYGWSKGLKIHNNKIRTEIRDVNESSFSFNIELWTGVGGVEIYDNDLNGAIDIGGFGWWDDYDYGYAVKVYNNIITLPARLQYGGEAGIVVESGATGGVYIYNNKIKSFTYGIELGCTEESIVQGYDGVYIYCNVCEDLGFLSSGSGGGIYGYFDALVGGYALNDIQILNNTFNKVNATSGWGISFETDIDNTWTNVIIRNNIIDGFYTPFQFRDQGSVNNINVDNNLIYRHTRPTIPDYTNTTVTNATFNNNQVGVNPLFISSTDFHLRSSSPAINAGIDVGLTEDIEGNLIVGLSDIGAYEHTTTTYYISQSGNNTTGTGTIANPWATLSFACTQVLASGDTIYVLAGTIVETAQSVLAPGVSIVGAGSSSIITTAAALNPMILASSVAEGTDGNQSISYVRFDGDNTALNCISILRRSNFVIHNTTFVDFLYTAVEFQGGSSWTSVTTYATGNVIRNSSIIDCCSRRDPGNFGAIRIAGTTGMEVHDCILTGTGRASTENGNLLYLWGATNKAFKFYNNTCTKPNTDGVQDGYAGGWNFHIESGNSSGFEVYNNTFIGGVAIDLAGGIQVKGAYAYSWYIHDNDFSLTAQIATSPAGTHPPHAIDYERTNEDVIVARNTFTNYPCAINITLDENTYHKLRLWFYYNIFSNCGLSDGLYAFGGIQFVGTTLATGNLCSYVYIDNNVFEADGARGLIHLQSPYNLDHFYIRNNIFVDAASYGWLNAWDHLGDDLTDTGTYDNFVIQNNLLYNNANANAIYYRGGKTITNLTGWSPQTNILADNPDFVSAVDFHLQAGSPCINAGIDVGITSDHAGQPVGNPPEIGAYQYLDEEVPIVSIILLNAKINKFFTGI